MYLWPRGSVGGEVEAGFFGLGVLVFAGDAVEAAVFEQVGTCLMECERNACGPALAV